MTTPKTPVPAATPAAPFTPTGAATPADAPAPSARETELLERIAKLEADAAEAAANPTEASKAVTKLKKGFEVPEGEEKHLHVIETQVNGEAVTPRVRAYDPQQYDTMIAKQAGYKADVISRPKAK